METEVCGTATKAVDQVMSVVCNSLRHFTKTSEVGDLAITRDSALAIYNQVAVQCGKPTLDSVGAIYQVEVNWNDGTTLLVVEEVEADDEDDAVDMVRDGLNVDEVSLHVSLSYGANKGGDIIYGLDWELDNLVNESLEFRATEL